jgi:hypothetical protein
MSAEVRVARLRGHLQVLLAVEEELQFIGASPIRLLRHRDAIARVRSDLARLGGGKFGDHTDATGLVDS